MKVGSYSVGVKPFAEKRGERIEVKFVIVIQINPADNEIGQIKLWLTGGSVASRGSHMVGIHSEIS